MIIMDIKLNNLCAFKDFHINMSYPKKIVNSTIENESLENFPNFRYKKVNILMGTNASGKTSLGKVLMSIFTFIKRKELLHITDRIADREAESSFSIDFVLKEVGSGRMLYRLEVKIPPEEKDDYSLDKCKISLDLVSIGKGDSYEKCIERFPTAKKIEGVEGLGLLSGFRGWHFTYPRDSNDTAINNIVVGDLENATYLRVLKNILMTLDNSIEDVRKLNEIENTYAIIKDNKNLIIQNGEILDPGNILSSGTKAGIDLAYFLTALIEHRNGFYYCDEKFSYIHSEIEKTLLSVMISELGKEEQLFFTTHNTDIAEMNLPKHSFWFMKKENFEGDISITCEPASSKLKKSTDSLKNAIDNDIFGAAPRVELLYELKEGDTD